MRGSNVVAMSGNVGDVLYGTTKTNRSPACSFMLASEKRPGETVWVRVNVYGGLAVACEDKLKKGGYVVVEGELMNRLARRDDDRMVEIRCESIVFVPKEPIERSIGFDAA